MKTAKLIVKIAVALAAVAGAVYVIATYGEKIVAWCKKLLSSLPCCECKCCEGECECTCECTEEAAEEPAAEEVAEAEAVAEEAPAVEEIPVEEPAAEEAVAEEADFEA